MLYTIENDVLRASIDSVGAELRSLQSKADGFEYIWGGDEAVWGGSAPILFPFVGGVKDSLFCYGGAQYPMQKHGFARESVFSATPCGADTLEFVLTSDRHTLACYPFAFHLTVRFSLQGHTLHASHTVHNAGSGDMWFSIGAHPGFVCRAGDVLRFSLPEQIEAYRLQNGLLGGKEPFLCDSDCWMIADEPFVRDAYILEGLKSTRIALERADSSHPLLFHFGAPYLGIWKKPGANYLCLEPWFGIDETPDHDHELTHKVGVEQLSPGGNFALHYAIEASQQAKLR